MSETKKRPGLKHGTTNNPNGRPKKEPTRPLYRRVPIHLYDACQLSVDRILFKKQQSKSTKKMDKVYETLKANRLLGEFIGTLKGVCAWDIPQELRLKLQTKIEELSEVKIEP